jgi:hypothetical protein
VAIAGPRHVERATAQRFVRVDHGSGAQKATGRSNKGPKETKEVGRRR